MSQVKLEPGLRGLLSHQVTDRDLATNWRNDVPVLATPILLWLAELACMRAIEGTLEPGKMTLGAGHKVRHLAPTPLDWSVKIDATLIEVDGKLLTFVVNGTDGADTVLDGYHTRAIADRNQFFSRVEAKSRISVPDFTTVN